MKTDAWSLHLATDIIFGVNSIKSLKDVMPTVVSGKILFVAGRHSLKKEGDGSKVLEQLKEYPVILYEFSSNPTKASIEKAFKKLRNEEIDLVIALGGGSVIDFSKAMALILKTKASWLSFFSQSNVDSALPIIAIPTTAGGGSEVTPYASVIDEESKKKISLNKNCLRPSVAIVDPSLMVGMPKSLTAISGLDALSQCIEAYWSRNHTPVSDLFALQGLKLVVENIIKACKQPDNLTIRSNMALASLFSGIAISIAQTTIVHSVSYPITVHFKVPHGLACALTLPSFIRFNSKSFDGRIDDMADAIGANSSEAFALKIEQIISDLQLPNLSDYGLTTADIEMVVSEGFRPDRAKNNPFEVSAEQLKLILKNILLRSTIV